MSDQSPVEQLAEVGIIKEDDLNDKDKEVINSLTADEVATLISVREKIHFDVPLQKDKRVGFPF